ncbi:hypothetical protein DXA02_02835 [Ruminococcus sp. AM54-1NS]|nr:hypothetical protein DXA02_02835 [Ruminococcus sp. AM54-1NS]
MSEKVSGEELEKINGYAREPLTEDKVFVFRVALCDNDIDRDGEKFSSGALEKLAELLRAERVFSTMTLKAQSRLPEYSTLGWKLCLRKLRQTERSTAGLWQRLTWCVLRLTATL